MYNNRIRKVGTNGIITTVAGNGINGYSGDGGAATNASLSVSCGVAVDASGNLFIADHGQQPHPQGGHQRHHHDGGGQWRNGLFRRRRRGHQRELNYPLGVAVDASATCSLRTLTTTASGP